MTRDICLATVSDDKWKCHSRNHTVTSDGFLSFEIQKLNSIYSVIFNPDPSQLGPIDDGGGDEKTLW